MYVKGNPHLSILESMYELVKSNQDDQESLKLLADVLWALEFDLGFTEYTYHYLAELSSGIGTQDTESNDHYIKSIEAKIKELKDSMSA